MITEGEGMGDDEPTVAESQDERGWGERLAEAAAQAGDLLRTRAEIFREEAAEKATHAARGAAAMAIAIGLGIGAILLFGAFIAAVFARLFGSVPLGILAAFILYAALAGLFGWRASKALARVRPGEFPATRDELRRDVEAIQAALAFGGDSGGLDDEDVETRGESEVEDLEARFRAGAE